MATQALRCVVRYHRGIEQQESVPEDEDPYDTLLLRIIIGLPGAPESSADELQLHGRWAALLQTTGPEDLLLVEGAEELTDAEHSGRCFSVLGETPAVTIYREGIHHRVDKETFQSLHLPEWLRPPPTSKVGGAYRYHRWLCTLRDGADANLWAVVWENALPGPAFERSWARQNWTVVDPSFDHAACAEWCLNKDFPLYGLTISVQGPQGVEKLPFLCLGDVVRVHRARIGAKPPRYINIRQQTHSSVLAFPCPDQVLAEADSSEVTSCPIQGETHTVVAADKSRARRLQAWIQQRLQKETASKYLVTVSELQQLQIGSKRDVVVKVLALEPNRLMASDGSLPVPVSAVSKPRLAATWLASQVKVGHWLRLQQAQVADPAEADLSASAATVTRMPEWCLDVQLRRRQMDSQKAQDRPGNTKRAAKGAQRGSGDTELDEEEETPPNMLREAMPAAAAVAAPLARPRTQLRTVYADTVKATRLEEMAAASARGVRCLVLTGFTVTRICSPGGADATRVESLVVMRCRCCGHTYPAPNDLRGSKRRRKVMPCGHWLFSVEFRFKLMLQEDDGLPVAVHVAHEVCQLLGGSAEEVADPAARQKMQQRLDALREDLGRPRREHGHAISVFRHDGPSTAVVGSYVLCDTVLELLPR
ncbi:unnamed protein product [Effrenium voratum]|nr:unnamed protein product [Effrenium voratum]